MELHLVPGGPRPTSSAWLVCRAALRNAK